MQLHPIRRALRAFGVDIHRFHARPDTESWIASLGITTALDVGANTGQFVDEIRALYPSVPVHAFEPHPACVAALHKKAATIADMYVYPVAVGERSGTTTLSLNAYSPSSSLIPLTSAHTSAFPHAKEASSVEVPLQTLDSIAFARPLEEPLLVNIDVQGYEREVIRGGSAVLSRARLIIIECSFVELYKGQALFPEIATLLGELGFTYRGAWRHKADPRTGEPLFEDALFYKS